MEYEALLVYGLGGDFVGYTLRKEGLPKFSTVNIWSEAEKPEFAQELERLNESGVLKEFWPEAHDQEVQDLLDNLDWEPLKMEEAEVLDHDTSKLVIDEETQEIDWANSELAYKTAQVPNATDVQRRVFKAQETIARKRAKGAQAANTTG